MVYYYILFSNYKLHYSTLTQGDSQGMISEESIDKAMRIGWVVIGLLMATFFLNLIFAIGIEYPNIKKFCLELKAKLGS